MGYTILDEIKNAIIYVKTRDCIARKNKVEKT